MKKALLLTLGLSTVLLAGVSCSKDCSIPEEDAYSGVIISEVNQNKVIIYPSSGGKLSSFPNGLHVSSNSPQVQQDWFEVSFDGGLTRQPVDFSQYNIIGYPLSVKCDAAVGRDLTVNPLTGSGIFTMSVQECESCDELRSLENYILVDDSLANYNITYSVQ